MVALLDKCHHWILKILDMMWIHTAIQIWKLTMYHMTPQIHIRIPEKKLDRKPKKTKHFDGVKIQWSAYLKYFCPVLEWNDQDEHEMDE